METIIHTNLEVALNQAFKSQNKLSYFVTENKIEIVAVQVEREDEYWLKLNIYSVQSAKDFYYVGFISVHEQEFMDNTIQNLIDFVHAE